MNKFDHVEALLFLYPRAEMLAEAVREGARVRAALSYRSPRDTLSVMESIARDMQYAEHILRWKGAIDASLRPLSANERFLLEYKYFRRRRQLQELGSEAVFACSKRSYFRKQNALLIKFSALLEARGCTEQAFFSDFEGFSPVMRILSALRSGRGRQLLERREACGLRFGVQNSSASAAEGALRPRTTKKAMAATARMPKISAAISMPESAEEVASSSAGGSSAGPETSVR